MKLYRLPNYTIASAAFALSTAASSAAYVIYGPTNISVPTGNDTNAVTVASSQLNGQDQLFITWGVTRPDLTITGDGWLALSINDIGEGIFDFNDPNESDLGVLTRTNTGAAGGGHTVFQSTSGSWAPGNSSVDFDAASPASHQMRLTISGLSTGGFTGSHAFTYEIDHNASSFGTADRTYTGTFTFATNGTATDEGLRLELRSNLYEHTATNFTVFQIPEPSAAVLGGLGLLALLRRRR